MPAERAIELGTDAFNSEVADSRRESVSEIVEGGDAERRDIRDSIAATGFVIRGSVDRMLLYVLTTLLICQ